MIFSNRIIFIYSMIMMILIGAVLGSFLNCLAERMVNGESVIKGRSHCSKCKHVLRPFDLIPVVSWILNKGKCRYCHEKISVRYPITELIMILSCVMLLAEYGWSWLMLRNLIFICCLFVSSLVDLDIYEIPESCIVISIVNWIMFIPLVHNDWMKGIIGGIILGGGIGILTLIMNKLLAKESMGGGDIQLLFVSGLYSGTSAGLSGLVIACFIGLFMAGIMRKNRIPFGPALSAGIFIMLLIETPFMMWYLGLY